MPKAKEKNPNVIETAAYGDVIYFNKATHAFWRMENGEKKKIKSVTRFTGVVDKSAQLVSWAIRLARKYLITKLANKEQIVEVDIIEACKQHTIKKKEAADIGTLAHEWVSDWIGGKNPPMPENPAVERVINSFLHFMEDHDIKWVKSEFIVWSKKHNYAGIADALAEFDGKIVLVDFKSASGLYPENALQVAAYQLAYEEMTGIKIDYRMCIRLAKLSEEEYLEEMKDKNRTNFPAYVPFEVKQYVENEEDQQAFLAAVVLGNRIEELDDYGKE